MHARSIVMVLLAVAAGWGLGWYSHDRRGVERAPPGSAARLTPPPVSFVRPPRGENSAARRATEAGIADMLDDGAFGRAVAHYESLQARADGVAAEQARTRILSHARRLIGRADYASATQLLERYLLAEYRSVEARMLLADAYRGANELRAAIDQLYEAKGQEWRPEVLERLTRRIRTLASGYADTLKQNGDANGLLALYQHLTQLEPSYAPWFIALANAQLDLDDTDAARQSLLLVAQDSQVGAQARELLERVDAAAFAPPAVAAAEPEPGGAAIPLLRRGSHFLVDAGLGAGHTARLLIDTGASLTMLSERVLDARSVGARDTGRTDVFNTANGRVRAPIYRLDSLSVGDWQINDIEVGVLAMHDAAIDGLLGMNFLRHFRFYIDQNEAVLRLSIAESD